MKRITTIALFAGIFAIAVGTLGFSGTSATSFMISAEPQTQQGMNILGHVEYQLVDDSGNVKQYLQGDNAVVENGKDCVAQALFDSVATVGACGTTADFEYIAIGNSTAAAVTALSTASTDANLGGGACAATASAGEMARRVVIPTFTAATGGVGAKVELNTSGNPFTFGVSNSSDPIIDSGIFDGAEGATDAEGQCTTLGTANMFSIQALTGDSVGISVSSGDSLSVKWTITIG